jgi:release factor glutamine methyltransferase
MFSRTRTVKESFQHFQHLISTTYEADEARSISQMVFKEILGYNTIQLILNENELIPAALFEQLDQIAFLINENQPIQYILGYEEFMGINFKVNPAVLIPRPETEELVEWIIKDSKLLNHLSILDIGTGSGCIAISLKKNLPFATVSAIDISDDALKTASQNAKQNQIEVHFSKVDVLSQSLTSTYNVIVSNPPYVLEAEKLQMHRNVLDFEPSTALFVPDTDPLLFYKRIVSLAYVHLNSGGCLYFEINESFAEQTLDLFPDSDWFEKESRKDFRGKDRFVKARKR